MNEQSAPPAMPQPTAEHSRIAESVGVWNVECEFNMAPGQPPMRVDARETVQALGPFWTVSRFESDMFGSPYVGSATVGFDPARGKYVSTWIDSMAPAMYSFEGTVDAGGKLLEMHGEGPDCMGGGIAKYRTTERRVSRDERVFEMFMTSPGAPEMKLFRHIYRRAK